MMLTTPRFELDPVSSHAGDPGPLPIRSGEEAPIHRSVCVIPGSMGYQTPDGILVPALDEEDVAAVRLIVAAPRMPKEFDTPLQRSERMESTINSQELLQKMKTLTKRRHISVLCMKKRRCSIRVGEILDYICNCEVASEGKGAEILKPVGSPEQRPTRQMFKACLKFRHFRGSLFDRPSNWVGVIAELLSSIEYLIPIGASRNVAEGKFPHRARRIHKKH